MSSHCPHHAGTHRQQGAVLLIGLVFLAILMIGATSLMNATISDERMTGNSKTNAEAFFAAEAGRRALVDHVTAASMDESTPSKKAEKIRKARENWEAIHDTVVDNWDSDKKNPHALPGFANVSFSNNGQSAASSYTVMAEPVYDKNGNIDSNKLKLASQGQAGKARRMIGFDLDMGGGGMGLPPAPAAISCFGGPCTIEAGAASKAPISGQNHATPSEGCSGKSCWLAPKDSDKAVVPAVFFSSPSGSDVELQGGSNGKKLAFIGLDRFNSSNPDNSSVASGTDKDSGAVWGPLDYPDDDDNKSTAPSDSDYAGKDGSLMKDVYTATENADSTLGTINSPKASVVNPSKDSFTMPGSTAGGVLLVEGTDNDGEPGLISHKGTGAYVGLIVIRDCNQVNFGGNFSVYGAIIVDATDCPSDYKPFFGNGTPDVKYSSDALNTANENIGMGLNGDMEDWYEIVSN